MVVRQPLSKYKMSKTLQVTELARKHFQTAIKRKQAHGVLFLVKKAGCSGLKYEMSFIDEVPDSALLLPYSDVALYVDKDSHEYLKHTCVDLVQQSLGQTKVVFLNPNAQNACGCGESFNLKQDQDE